MSDKFNNLAKLLKQGNRRAGEEIFDYFSPQIYRFFVVRTLSKETAEDLIQEAFLKLISHIDSFNEELGPFSAWFWQIVRNTAKDYYRKKKALPLSDEILRQKEQRDFAEGKGDPETGQRLAEINELLKTFDEEEQEIFSLRYLSGLSYREISHQTGKSEVALRVSIHRLNQKIRKLL